MSEIQYIKNEALSLPVGETTQVECCFCGKPKLSITRKEDAILYNCWSASCHGKGVIGSVPFDTAQQYGPGSFKVFKARPFTEGTERIMGKGYDFLMQKYRIKHATVQQAGWKAISSRNGILMPLFDAKGHQYGQTTKYFDGNKKAIHFIEEPNCMNHYAMPRKTTGKAVLVEDVISSARISQDCETWQGVALLGTDLNDAKVKDLLTHGYNNVIIALDRDAQNKGLEYVQKWGLFFNQFQARCLSDDPKDLSPDKLREELFE